MLSDKSNNLPDQDDEIFESYIAKWNITKLRNYLKENKFQLYKLNKGQYENLITSDQTVNESKIEHVDLSDPIIVAKIKDEHLLIDGIHRVRKAKKNNEYLFAYIVPFEVHSQYTVGTVYF